MLDERDVGDEGLCRRSARRCASRGTGSAPCGRRPRARRRRSLRRCAPRWPRHRAPHSSGMGLAMRTPPSPWPNWTFSSLATAAGVVEAVVDGVAAGAGPEGGEFRGLVADDRDALGLEDLQGLGDIEDRFGPGADDGDRGAAQLLEVGGDIEGRTRRRGGRRRCRRSRRRGCRPRPRPSSSSRPWFRQGRRPRAGPRRRGARPLRRCRRPAPGAQGPRFRGRRGRRRP